MDIVIIAHFCGDFSEMDNGRFKYIAEILCKNNYVEVITSSFNHTTKSHIRRSSDGLPFKITFIEEPGYRRNVSLSRFGSHRKWGKNLMKYINNREHKPDVVYCAVPSLTGPNLVSKYCEESDIRFIVDVQDLWPEAYRMVVNVPLLSDIAYAPFKSLADGIYKRADAICAVSDTYCRRAAAVNKKVRSTTTVFLGTELETFDRYALRKSDVEKKPGEIWIAYCGTLGSSYDLSCVIDALGLLDNDRITFIVMGDGPKMDVFMNQAREKTVRTRFLGRLSYNEMCSVLACCDMAVNPISHGASQSIINKHADYSAAGLPIINTQENQEYRDLIEEYEMGINCKNNDPLALAKAIRHMMETEEERIRMGQNSRKCAEERFDRNRTYRMLVDTIINNPLS